MTYYRKFTLFSAWPAAIALVTLFTAGANADPLPGRDVLKFSQLPMDGTTIIDPNGTVTDYFGHDELSTAWGEDLTGTGQIDIYRGRFMADDFADNFDSPVVHVKWWGSYLNRVADQEVNKFLISFEMDVPAIAPGFSHPGTPILNQVVFRDPDGALSVGEGTFLEKSISLGGPPLDEELFEYNAELHLGKEFFQQADEIYWLKIVALVDLPPGFDPNNDPLTEWGWHNRDYTIPNALASLFPTPGEHIEGTLPGGEDVWHFQDDAVEGDVTIDTTGSGGLIMPVVLQDPATFLPTNYLDGIDGPGDAINQIISQFSKDLAFELYTIPEPATCMLLLIGLTGMFVRRC